VKKTHSFTCICVISAFIFFSCIITPQPRESGAPAVSPVASVPAVSPLETIPWVSPPETIPQENPSEFGIPEYIPSDLSSFAVSSVASVPAISSSETIPWVSPSEKIPWVSPPKTIPQEIPPEVISQENPPETIPWVSPPETIPQEIPPEVISQENPPETIPSVNPPETIPQEDPPEVVTLAAAVTGWPITEPETSAIPPIGQGRVPVPEFIMGKGNVLPKELAAFLLESNPRAETAFIEELAYIYTEESAVEGVNSDVAFAQMCLETGFLRYGGLVTPDMNNFCGLGATGPVERGLTFPNPRTGVRAHIQHLKAYASEEPLKQLLIDPRFHYVRRGSSPAITGLAGTWAADPAYAEKIKSILERLYSFYYKL